MKTAGLVLASVLLASAATAFAQNRLLIEGEQVFNRSCATGYCHGVKGTPAGAPRLAARGFDQAYIESTVARGLPGTSMPPFAGSLPRPELDAVVGYVANLNGIAYSPTSTGANGVGQAKDALSPEAKRGRDLFSDAVRGFGRCSTCHELDGIGIPVATPIAKVPENAAALRILPTPSVRTAIFENQTMPALLLSNGTHAVLFYDLTTAPPVLHTAQPGTITWRDASDWNHSSFVRAYDDAELGSILTYLRSAAHP
ncbi:MAG TPA: cytochrome c [Bryobacteraceae bacterium]